ncbi:hypothetical protein BOX15_Mlig023729g5, partial [Macrostomum lignano]
WREVRPESARALFEVPVAENCQPGTVAVVTKVGYRLHERTLRPSSCWRGQIHLKILVTQ